MLDIAAGKAWVVKHRSGEDAEAILPELAGLAAGDVGEAVSLMTSGERPVIFVPGVHPVWRLCALLGFREPGGRAWDADDLVLAESLTGLTRIVL